jgi:hypothetical protein
MLNAIRLVVYVSGWGPEGFLKRYTARFRTGDALNRTVCEP